MQSLALFWSAVLFVLSSGLVYYERFRKNKLIVGIAVILAIGSTVSFLYGIWPGISPLSPPSDVSTVDVEAATEQLESASDPMPTDTVVPDCDWAGGETVTQCLTRMRESYSEREAVRIVFNSRGTNALVNENQPDSAVRYFTVAIQNSDTPDSTPDRLLRGVARVYAEDFAGALSDCDTYYNSGAMRTANAVEMRSWQAAQTELFHMCRGVALSKLGRHREALPALDAAIASGAGDIRVYGARMISREETGDAEGARSDFHIWFSLTMDGMREKQAQERNQANGASSSAGR